MKICPYCQTRNHADAVLCIECMKSIGGIAPEREGSADRIMNEFFEKEEKRDRLKTFLWYLPMIVYYAVYIPLYILSVMKDRELFGVLLLPLFLPVLYYLLVFKAEFLFKLNHMFDIDNLDEVNISEWYFFTGRLSGFIILIIGIIMMASVCLETYSIKIGGGNSIVVELPSVDEIMEDTVKTSYRFEGGFPSQEELRLYGAVFTDEDESGEAGSAFDAFWDAYISHTPGDMLFVMDGGVYQLIFDGDFLTLFEDRITDNVRHVVTSYPKKIIKNGDSYILVGDGNTQMLKIDL